MEIVERRLVGAELLGGDHVVKVDVEMAGGMRKEIVVDVREDHQPVTGLEPLEANFGGCRIYFSKISLFWDTLMYIHM